MPVAPMCCIIWIVGIKFALRLSPGAVTSNPIID
jgi:hypothetical protein